MATLKISERQWWPPGRVQITKKQKKERKIYISSANGVLGQPINQLSNQPCDNINQTTNQPITQNNNQLTNQPAKISTNQYMYISPANQYIRKATNISPHNRQSTNQYINKPTNQPSHFLIEPLPEALVGHKAKPEAGDHHVDDLQDGKYTLIYTHHPWSYFWMKTFLETFV